MASGGLHVSGHLRLEWRRSSLVAAVGVQIRTVVGASVAVLGLLSCRRPEPINIMMEPPTCDSVPPPLAPGERAGAELPSGITPTSGYGTVIGVVVQARTGRPLPGVTLSFRPVGSTVGSTPVARTLSNGVGGFSVGSVPPGTYTLRTTMISYPPRERTVTVRSDAIDTVRAEMTYMHCVGY